MRQRGIEILYEGGDWAVINKPARLPLQGGGAVRANLRGQIGTPWGMKPYLVHRLDRDTAGCLVVARSSAAAKRMGRVLSEPATKKTYLAVVRGCLREPEGEITESVTVHGVPKQARTRYRTRQSLGDQFSLLELRLDTGRMHQIRVHLAGLGHPILGDDRHGDFALNKSLRRDWKVKRLLLFAWRLELANGASAEAPYPKHFAEFLNAHTLNE